MSKLRVILILLILSTMAYSANKHSTRFEDFFSMQRLGSVALSPDNSMIAYSLTTPIIVNNTFKTDIYLLDLKNGESSKFSQSEESSSDPVWSPDSKYLYFNRDGQIWKKSLAGETVQQVTSFSPGVGGMVFDASGKKILFTAEVYPDCVTEECNQQKAEALKNSKVKARVIDHLFFRHWNRWLEGKRSHVFVADADGRNPRDMTPGDYDSPPLDLGSAHDYTFSPDGQEVCFVRNTDPIVAASTNNDLFTANVTTGEIQKLTSNKGNDNNPNYSPDGRFIAYASMERAGFEADRQRLILYDRSKKTTIDLTEGFDLSVASIVWHPSGQEIYFTVSEMGSRSIYKVNIHSAKIEPVLKGHFLSDMQFTAENDLIFKLQNEAMPYEIFKYNLKNKALTQLSHINSDRLNALEMGKLEPFSFTGAKNELIHGFLMKPPQFDPEKKYPAIELIHGGPQGAWGDDYHFRWNYQMFAAKGYVVFMINFHGSRGYGQDFVDAVSKDWGGAPYEDIMKGTQYVLDTYSFIDRDRVGAAGASYGGFMINWIAGGENPFKCLVTHDGVYEQVSMWGSTEELWFPEWEFNGLPWEKSSLYQKWSPANRAGNFKTPTLVVHGEHDYRVPYTQGLQMFSALQRQGVKSRLLFFPDEDHFVRKPQNARLWWKTVNDWFAEFLK